MADGPLKEFLANSNVDAGPGDASEIEEVLGSVLQKKTQSGDLTAVKEMFSGADTPPDSPDSRDFRGLCLWTDGKTGTKQSTGNESCISGTSYDDELL